MDLLSDERWDLWAVFDPGDTVGFFYTSGLTALGRPELLMVEVPWTGRLMAQGTLTFVGRLSLIGSVVDGGEYSAGIDDFRVRAEAADPTDPAALLGFAIKRFGPGVVRALRLEPITEEP